MSPATWPRDATLDERLLRIDPARRAFDDARVRDLPRHLCAGDLLVVNDAATLPASLGARSPASGRAMEVRLAGGREPDGTFWAVLFGEGDWRTPTEHRPAPDALGVGSAIAMTDELSAVVVELSPRSPRLVRLGFDLDDDALFPALYRAGRPVQYAYLARPLELFLVQTRYGSRPWAAELPSAGRPLTWGLLGEIARGGVRLARITHAAGLSSTGDPTLDAALPLPERYDIPAETVDAVRATRLAGGRVVAVGTSVVRALEGNAAAHDGALVAGAGTTDLVIREGFRRRIVDGLLTGIHEPTASHFDLLRAFAPTELLDRAYAHAADAGYLCHEFGDSNLILSAAA